MKLIVASILALCVVACVAPPDTQPEPETALRSETSALVESDGAAPRLPWAAVWLCVNDDSQSCVAIPITFDNARAECIRICRLVGDPDPICLITPVSRLEC
jgi:hypothetical protein